MGSEPSAGALIELSGFEHSTETLHHGQKPAMDRSIVGPSGVWPHGPGGVRLIGASVSSCRMRSAAPSRSSYCPLLRDHMKAASAARPRPSAMGIRYK